MVYPRGLSPLRVSALVSLLMIFAAFPLIAQPQQQTAGSTPASGGGAPAPPRAGYPPDQVGYASWYGSRFHGRLTASGQVYDMNKMTAANKTLPFGTKVLVTNLSNGKSCEVTINDRGPYVAGRIIDLSRAAAESIGLTGMGVAKVRMHIISLGNGARVRPPARFASSAGAVVSKTSGPGSPRGSASAAPVIVQLGAFRDLSNAVRLKAFLDRNGFDPLYEKDGDITRVVLVSVPAVDVASVRKRLATIGITSILVRHE